MKRCSPPRRWIVAALGVLLAPVLLHAAFVLVPGLASYVVVSPSMEPAIGAGSVVYLVGADEYDVGDVVTYDDGRRLVTHRIVDRTEAGYVTRGDANDGDDETVPSDSIVGRVVFSVPLYGYLFRAAATTFGYVFLVAVPSALLVGYEVRRIVRALRGR